MLKLLAALLLITTPVCYAEGPCATEVENSLKALAPKTEHRYGTVPLQKQFQDEEHGKSKAFGTQKIRYLDAEELEKRRVVFSGDHVYDHQGKPIRLHGDYFYVMDDRGNFYFVREGELKDFKHSSFLRGRPIACAGKANFVLGKLRMINNESGHYLPTRAALRSVVLELAADGFDINHLRAGAHEWSATKFIQDSPFLHDPAQIEDYQ